MKNLWRCGTFGIILDHKSLGQYAYWSKHTTGLHGEDWKYEQGNIIQGKVKSLKCPQGANGNTWAQL